MEKVCANSCGSQLAEFLPKSKRGTEMSRRTDSV